MDYFSPGRYLSVTEAKGEWRVYAGVRRVMGEVVGRWSNGGAWRLVASGVWWPLVSGGVDCVGRWRLETFGLSVWLLN
jgi:hypothetical protein